MSFINWQCPSFSLGVTRIMSLVVLEPCPAGMRDATKPTEQFITQHVIFNYPYLLEYLQFKSCICDYTHIIQDIMPRGLGHQTIFAF